MSLTFGSLFAGVGGFDLGFEAAGWQCAFQVEWDKHCQQVLARHWPDVPRWSDVSTVNGAELPPVDCITFGSPCQDLSVAGKRAGLDGNRSNLFFEATRIIKEMRDATGNQYPRIAVWENVPGALSSNKGADFSAVLDNLADSGALAIEWAMLDAQHFGIPQRRRRIFLVSIYDPSIARNCGTQILSVTKGSRRNTQKGNTERQITSSNVGQSIERTEPVIFTAQRVGEPPRIYENTTPSLLSRMGTGGNNVPMIAKAIPIQDGREIEKRQNGLGVGNEGDPAYTLDTTGAQSVAHTISFGWKENFYAGQTYDEITTALTTTKTPAILAPTLTAANNPSRSPQSTEITNQVAAVFEAQYAVRRLTPIECERLMGWPDDHTAGQADSHRYKQCGNGVAAPVAAWVAKHLRRISE